MNSKDFPSVGEDGQQSFKTVLYVRYDFLLRQHSRLLLSVKTTLTLVLF
jgi:hypothetical protein